jgi:hypothetical protein
MKASIAGDVGGARTDGRLVAPGQAMHRARAVANEGAMIRNTRAGRKRGNTRSTVGRRERWENRHRK